MEKIPAAVTRPAVSADWSRKGQQFRFCRIETGLPYNRFPSAAGLFVFLVIFFYFACVYFYLVVY
jgi:hypothetical protein